MNDEKKEVVYDIENFHSEALNAKYFVPIVETLKEMGGSANASEVKNKILQNSLKKNENISDDEANKIKIAIGFARNALADEGFISRKEKTGIWKLTDKAKYVKMTRKLAGQIVGKVNRINAAKREHKLKPNIDLSPHYTYYTYTKDDFLNEVFITEQRYDMLVSILKNKKNIILQGAPGVGKTFAAKRLAYSIMGETDYNRIELVQFHQNYSYEDFIMGYKPTEDNFELKEGIFHHFCKKAENNQDKDYFFIIDEINRGNMSKIFGELLMLIENDYRGTEITLAYDGSSFSVPENLYIIGMMNTADRSLAMIDYALRRRFSFFEMEPGFDSEGFVQYQTKLNNDTFNQLIEKIKELNTEIANDRSLGKGFRIGHSYFCNWNECTDEKMQAVVDFDILPMLDEYWFDDTSKLQRWTDILHGVFQ